MLIDTHGHLNLADFESDLLNVIDRIEEAEMMVIVPGTEFASSRLAIELVEGRPFIKAAIGLHPGSVQDEEFSVADYQELINTGSVVAIGECGLDYYRLPLDQTERQQVKDLQQETFEQQIILAQDNNLPLIVHGRNGKDEPEAYQRIMKLLAERSVERAVIHCFGGTLIEAHEATRLGYYLGITGIITFDKTGVLEQIIKEVSLDKILIETDAPFLSPEPYRGKRNEPIYVIEVARKIAEIKGMSLEEVIEQTGKSAKKLFNL